MKKFIPVFAAVGIALGASPADAGDAHPTVVLVHGAFADSSSWNGVIRALAADGYPVVAAANPLRSVSTDSEYVARILSGIKTPVVLVGHSYGGFVINDAAARTNNVKALVFVAAFAPDAGETALKLTGQFPGSTLAPTLAAPVALSGGGNDLYILQDRFPDQFAADVPARDAKLMAATQRPVAEAALNEPAATAAWKRIPSWFVYGDQDRNIPPQALGFMAKRASSRDTVVVKGASHVVMVSHPAPVVKIIEEAARAGDAKGQ